MDRADNHDLEDRDGHSGRQIYGRNQGSIYMSNLKIIVYLERVLIFTPGSIVVLGTLVIYLI